MLLTYISDYLYLQNMKNNDSHDYSSFILSLLNLCLMHSTCIMQTSYQDFHAYGLLAL